MAISVAATDIGAWKQQLSADTTETVTFARDCDDVRVVNVDGAADIYVTVDGTDPAIQGKKTFWVPAVAMASRTIHVVGSGNTVVKLRSVGAPVFSIEGNIS